MKKLLFTLIASLLTFGAANASEQTAPKSIVHVVTIVWKPGTTPEQIKAALDGAQALPDNYKGLTHVWTKTVKAQGDKANAIVMEFVDDAAFKAYTDSPAQKEWYKVYLPIRGHSETFDITN
jgi:hypothetical protein